MLNTPDPDAVAADWVIASVPVPIVVTIDTVCVTEVKPGELYVIVYVPFAPVIAKPLNVATPATAVAVPPVSVAPAEIVAVTTFVRPGATTFNALATETIG